MSSIDSSEQPSSDSDSDGSETPSKGNKMLYQVKSRLLPNGRPVARRA